MISSDFLMISLWFLCVPFLLLITFCVENVLLKAILELAFAARDRRDGRDGRHDRHAKTAWGRNGRRTQQRTRRTRQTRRRDRRDGRDGHDRRDGRVRRGIDGREDATDADTTTRRPDGREDATDATDTTDATETTAKTEKVLAEESYWERPPVHGRQNVWFRLGPYLIARDLVKNKTSSSLWSLRGEDSNDPLPVIQAQFPICHPYPQHTHILVRFCTASIAQW